MKKVCTKCGIEKDIIEFRLYNNKWYCSTCKKCKLQQEYRWKKANRAKVLASNRKYYVEYRQPEILTYGKKNLEDLPKKKCGCGCGGLVSPKESFPKNYRYRTIYYTKYIEGHSKYPNCMFCGGTNPNRLSKYCSKLCMGRMKLKREKADGRYERWKEHVKNSEGYMKKLLTQHSNLDANDISQELSRTYKTFIQLKREVKNVKANSI